MLKYVKVLYKYGGKMNNEVLKNISYGVYVATTKDQEKSTGCIVNSVMQVTQNSLAVSINHNNYTNECIKNNKKFAISILSTEVNDNIIPTFGFQTGRKINKFENIEKITIDNVDVIKDSIGYMICEVTDKIETSTHTVFIAKILDGDILNTQTPMTYAYYHTVKKGISPKNAPTYIETKEQKQGYKCSVCGYIYEGDINNEPDDFVCPVCKQPKSVFVKL